MADILLDIVTHEETIFSQKVDDVTMPGVIGSFEVLRNHAPLITSLTEGDIVYTIGGEKGSIHIKSGFVEVLDNKVSICAEV
jgi:F-type H+-transporting ATPase subunit epsilon